MGAMYRLKAYFGMVPAEDLGDYVEHADRYGRRSRRDTGAWGGRYEDRYERDDYDDGGAEYDEPDAYGETEGYAPEDYDRGGYEPGERYSDAWDRRERSRSEATGREQAAERDTSDETSNRSVTGLAAVRGSLAVDPRSDREPLDGTDSRPEPSLPEQRDRGTAALARITTLQPRSYYEARTIGERYRDGVPVIMNLTELDEAAARRLVDFAAGLAFALRGSIEKVTNRVFLLTPAGVEVSAEDARRIAGARVGPADDDDDRYRGGR